MMRIRPWQGWTTPPALAGVLAVLRLLPQVSRVRTLLLGIGVLAATVLPLAATVVMGLLIGAIPAAVGGGRDSPAASTALFWLGATALLIIANRLLAPFLTALASTFGRQVDQYLQERVMRAVGRPPGIAHLEDPAIRDLMDSAQGVGLQGHRPGDAVGALVSLLPSWLQTLGSAALLIGFQWWLGLAWLVLWPVGLYYLQREFIRVGQAAGGQASAVRRAGYYRDLALTPLAAKEVRIWGLPGWLTGQFDAAWLAAILPIRRARHPGRAVLVVSALAVTAADLLAFGLLAWAAIQGELTLAALAVYTRAAIDASGFRAFDDANTILARAAVAVPSLLELEGRLGAPAPHPRPLSPLTPGEGSAAPHPQPRSPLTPGEGSAAPHPRPLSPLTPGEGSAGAAPVTPVGLDGPQTAIRFEGVRFRYAGQDEDVIAGLDLTLPAGRSLAVVGANGAGKTTFVKLLCGLYEPTAGRITVDGMDLRAIDPVAWRARVAAIFQDFIHYPLSAHDNVAFGNLRQVHDRARLQVAARRAGAEEVVAALPRGWDTVLSREYTGGADLSGGEWQRLGLARALFAVEGGARVLILDEPTANLDVRAEAELYERFLDITAGLTTILISHRFSTVRRADYICVLAAGQVVEQGTHDELLAAEGLYAMMFRLQAERFTEQAGEEEA